ncbi:hypothetical protein DTL42_16040 [Bremerella cremea]|uniref:WD40 repeat domain-containing protein n=1 Tax=Bremerella cremea TaxID=1031537 RepID=A0A368KPH4_9BACT|nr:hypothetical protein [Bremerella cremea]RCS46467.1 hypothetical protein DTL42_16040 [Bremerella cremea]
MRFNSLCFRLACLFVLLASGISAFAQDQPQPPKPPAEKLVESWAKLAHRKRPPQIHKANEFDLSGPAVSKTSISKDGSTLLVLDTEGALVTWNLKTGEQIARILPEQASPDSEITISDNGNSVVIGYPSGLIEVYVPPKTKPLIRYDAFKTPIAMVRLSADQNRVIAIDQFGKSFEVDAFGKSKGFDPGPTEDTVVQSLIAAGGRQEPWWKVHVGPENKVTDVYYDGHERSENHLELEPPQFIDSANDNFMVGGPHQLAWVILYYKGEDKYEPTFKQIDIAETLYDAALVDYNNWIWTLTDKRLEVRETSFGRPAKFVELPAELPPEHTQILPNGETLVTITPEGHVTRWDAYLDTTSGISRLSVSVSNESFRQRFDALEMIAQQWNGRVDHFEDKEHETPYTFLMRSVQAIAPRLKGSDEDQPYPSLHKWIEENPDNSQFMRIVLFRLYLADGYRIRGGGYANSVPEDAWEAFYDNMEKSWEVVAPVFDQQDVPAEAYTCAIIAGKNLQWEREEVNKYLRQAFEKYPNYHRTFAEEAVARLPRWGGRPGETGYLARFTADKLGGVEGDIMYARIAQHVSRFVSWDDIDTETDFSRERIMKGMLAITETTEDAFAINQTLLLAAKWEDEESGLKAAKRLVELDLRPVSQIWPEKYDLIDKVYRQAKMP